MPPLASHHSVHTCRDQQLGTYFKTRRALLMCQRFSLSRRKCDRVNYSE
uniref:Uncharacterized protein n=1 Tax=Anguilla anguilla TaxID=7936 RepID=A0A0E9TPH8_ANGAN